MKKNLMRCTMLAMAVLWCAGAFAAIQYNGQDIYVTGDSGFLDGYSPSSNAALQLKDDGTGGDDVADDGVYSVTVTIPLDSTSTGTFNWKVASSGFSFECPGSFQNTRCSTIEYATLAEPVKFYFNTNNIGDGFRPDHDAGDCGIAFAWPNGLLSPNRDYFATGSWMDEAGLAGDWNPGDPGAQLSGPNGSGNYEKSFTGIAAAGYDFKLTIDGSFSNEINVGRGVSDGGGNGSFTVADPSDTITFEVDIDPTGDLLAGRVRVANDNPTVNPGPPFFAASDAWTTPLTTLNQLYDDASHGDCAIGDGIYTREFTVATPGEYGVRVRQFVGPAFPDSNNYPFVTTTPNQVVRVMFDTNSYSDSNYMPKENIVFVDRDAVREQSRIQPVGDWQFDFGALGNYDPAVTAQELVEVSDLIYSKTFTGGPASTSYVMKAVGEPDLGHSSPPWAYQFGGEGEGYTWRGDNQPPVPFSTDSSGNFTAWVDGITGRAGVGSIPPQRPGTIYSCPTAAQPTWYMYQ